MTAESGPTHGTIDHLFRRHAGEMVAVLGRIFGFGRLEMIEDAVQDALVAALRRWPFTGEPENPRAWLIQAAKNRMLDQIRRERRMDPSEPDEDIAGRTGPETLYFDSEIEEDQLRLIFACCHPAISPDSQVALTLKAAGGFSVGEIARAYLSNDEAVAKLLTRAKRRLIDAGVRLEMPPPAELAQRLDAVLRVLYLMFNEGYGAAAGDELIRRDLCHEAVRLADILARHPVTGSPRAHAAAALFFFQAARLPARTDHAGHLILLEDQDRSLWDRLLIARGLEHFRLSASGSEVSGYHLEAEIAALYTLAPSYPATDLERILACYDELQSRGFSSVVELNRVIVLGRLRGSDAALAALDELASHPHMASYDLFHITLGHFLGTAGRSAEAASAYRDALALAGNGAVRRFVRTLLDGVESAGR